MSVIEDSSKQRETSYFRRIEIIINRISIIFTFHVKCMMSSFLLQPLRHKVLFHHWTSRHSRVNTEKEIGEALIWNTYPSSFRTKVQKTFI